MNYQSLTRDQAISLLIKRDASRKLGLVWERDEIGATNRTDQDSFISIDVIPEFSQGAAPWENMVIEGDNLDALRWLRMTHKARVKAIYIDPPYNRGKRDFIYDDNYVGPNDRFRHSKWLEMAHHRLKVAKDLLRPDGVIFVSIGEDEVHTLGLLLDQVFDPKNRIGLIVWHNATDNNPTRIASEHEYVICYARDISRQPKEWKMDINHLRDLMLEQARALSQKHSEPEALSKAWKAWIRANKGTIKPFDEYDQIDPDGPYTGSRSVHNPGKQGYSYDIIHPKTQRPCKVPLNGYRFPEKTMRRLLKQDRIIFGSDENKIVELKIYLKDYRTKLSSVLALDGRRGANEMKELFPEKKNIFKNPKPTDLILELLAFVTSGDDIVLDFYAGSGTTGHAVMRLNAEDGGSRRYILVNQSNGYSTAEVPDEDEDGTESDSPKPKNSPGVDWAGTNICLDICAERLRRSAAALGIDSGFAYCRATPVAFEDIAFEITKGNVWMAVQAMHDVALRPYDKCSPLQSAVLSDGTHVIYCDKFTAEAESLLLDAVSGGARSFVYAWASGPLRERLSGFPNVEVRSMPDEMTERFR